LRQDLNDLLARLAGVGVAAARVVATFSLSAAGTILLDKRHSAWFAKMKLLPCAFAVAAIAAIGRMPAVAQSNPAPPSPPPRASVIIVNPNDLTRGPPPPPERPFAPPPPSLMPPMERIAPVAPLAPRIK